MLVLSGFFMVLVIDTVMTFTMTSIAVGWNSDFPSRFVRGWLVGFVVAYPTALLVFPLVTRLVRRILKPKT